MQGVLSIVLIDLEWEEESEFKNKQEKEKGGGGSIKEIREKRTPQFSSREPFILKDITTTD